jgi:hypothetical protein
MAATANKLVVVTGVKELDAKLRTLAPNLQRKFVRGALRNAGKRVQVDFKRIVKAEAYDTGAFRDSTKIKALKRSNKRIGIAFFTDTKKMYARRAAKLDKRTGNTHKVQEFFYPSVIEFGSKDRQPVRPMRRSLYDNEKAITAYFVADLRKFIAEQKVTASKAIKADSGFVGKRFKK